MSDIHAHYCETCQGYSPCHGWDGARTYSLDVTCLLPDPCVQCDAWLGGTTSVMVTR